jgi:hypothetical protein
MILGANSVIMILDNDIEKEGCKYLSDSLQHNSTLTFLNLKSN